MIYPYGDASTHLSSGNATTIVSSLLAACPRLEALQLSHGVMYRSSVEVARVGLPPFPSLGGALAKLPRTLHTLILEDFDLAHSSFDACDLPEVRAAALLNCGGASEQLRSTLLTRFAATLDPIRCVVDEKVRGDHGDRKITAAELKKTFGVTDENGFWKKP